MKKLGILGFGVMGGALAAAVRGHMPDLPIEVFDSKKEKLALLPSRLSLSPAENPMELVKGCDVCIICVKPQDLQGLSSEIRSESRGKRFISILAGKSTGTLASALDSQEIARFMPNLAAITGKSTVGVAFHPASSAAFREESLGLAKTLGAALEIPERLMAAMTGISGSGIAYALSFIHALSQGGVAAGFDYATALKIAIATMDGAVSLLAEGAHPMELVSRVTSPAGTTIQGIRALEKGGMTAAVMEAVEAAARRAQELEG
jgi:pyrroline-5-carboxylate reductase